MLPVNGDVSAMPRKVSCKLVIGGNTITDVKLLTYSSDWSGDITIGQVVSSYITATIPTPSFALTGANVAHSMSIGSPAEWVAIGQYTVDENSVRNKQGYTSFSAYDKLHDTVNTYAANAAYAETLQGLCNDVCNQIGIGTVANLGNIGATVVEKASLNGYTLRDVLGFVAAICGTNAYLDASNNLVLKWFSSTSYTADGTRANIPYVGENDCTVGRIICQGADGTYTYGSGEGIYFTCPLINADNQASLLSYIYSCVSGLTYRKADIDIPYGNFCLQSGDIITVSTTGSDLTVPIMANSFAYDGGLSSAVSAYGVSDYSGTANNAERSVSSRRVQQIMENKQTRKREQDQYTSLQGEIQHAAELITGATGGYIKLEFGGNGKTAQLLVMDQPSIEQSLNVWIFNQNGLGHMGRASTADPFDWTDVNLALTKEGTIVAERIAGTKISGVKLETFYKASSGLQSHIMIKDGTYTVNKCTVDSSGDLVGTPTFVGNIAFEPRSGQSDIDTLAIHIAQGGAFTIGTPNNAEYIYYTDLSTAPSGATKHNFFGGDMSVFGDLKFNSGATDSLNALKSTLDTIYNEIYDQNNGILARLDRLENP